MRLPPFTLLEPKTLDEALDLLARHRDDAKPLAGGTDLLVRMKKGIARPGYLVSLRALDCLDYIREDGGSVRIGSRTSLEAVIASNLVRTRAPALVQALESVGAPTIQHVRGTLGGNILQDNRCMHYNQSAFHRSGRQPCHKDGGRICYSREDADRCYSTCQSDGATALTALDAVLTLKSAGMERTVDLAGFYTTDGIMPFAMDSGELLTEITLPAGGTLSAYSRTAYRSAIDYPIACAGVRLTPSDQAPGNIASARIAVGAAGRSPLLMAKASTLLAGKPLSGTDDFEKAAKTAMDDASAFLVHNAGSTLEYRCAMIAQMVLTALNRAAGNPS